MTVKELQDFYSQLIAHLDRNLESMSIRKKQPYLYEILACTLRARKLRTEVQSHAFKNSGRSQASEITPIGNFS